MWSCGGFYPMTTAPRPGGGRHALHKQFTGLRRRVRKTGMASGKACLMKAFQRRARARTVKHPRDAIGFMHSPPDGERSALRLSRTIYTAHCAHCMLRARKRRASRASFALQQQQQKPAASADDDYERNVCLCWQSRAHESRQRVSCCSGKRRTNETVSRGNEYKRADCGKTR
jgi:hypothetical protein